MSIFDSSARTRWLLTLSAFGVACGQPAPMQDASNDSAAADVMAASDSGDATSDAMMAMDATAVTDTGVAPADAASDAAADAAPEASADAGVGPYPAGPYGSNMGDTLEDLQLDGYLNAAGTQLSTTLPYAPVSMQNLRETGRRYALVHTSATY